MHHKRMQHSFASLNKQSRALANVAHLKLTFHNTEAVIRSSSGPMNPVGISLLIYRMGRYFRFFPLGCFWKVPVEKHTHG